MLDERLATPVEWVREPSDSSRPGSCRCCRSEGASLTIESVVLAYSRRFHLSPAETSVVHLAAHGLSSKQIADARRSSAKTVETLWSRIYRKVKLPSQRDVLSALLREAVGRAGGAAPPTT
jgi:DNA-binding CsgD family transcriptional regulator